MHLANKNSKQYWEILRKNPGITQAAALNQIASNFSDHDKEMLAKAHAKRIRKAKLVY